MKKNNLYVPANISIKKNQIWQGFTMREALITGVVGAIVSVIVYIFVRIGVLDTFFGMMIAIGSFAVIGGALQKIENNMSVVDYLKQSLRYKKEQQTFKYQYKEEIENENEKIV